MPVMLRGMPAYSRIFMRSDSSIPPPLPQIEQESIVVASVAKAALAAIAVLGVVHGVAAQERWLDELRVGGAASVNDHPISGYAQFEALFSPLPAVATYDQNMSWLFSPRPLVGASISLQGKTSEAFVGLAWNVPLTGPFFLDMSFGGLVHNQNLSQIYPDRPTLTTRFLFRESIAVGYDINQFWRIIAFADHGSNGNLGYRNSSINHVGMMLSAKFGEPAKEFAAFAPPQISNFTWEGPYVGATGGIARNTLGVVLIDPAASTALTSGGSLNVGGYLGYNWTFGSLVAGVETDLTVQRLDSSATQTSPVHHTEEISVSSKWIATARARMGIDIERIGFLRLQRSLLYATGGAAFTTADKSFCRHGTGVDCYVNGDVGVGWTSESESKMGWIAGGGMQFPLGPHAAAKAEYLYANFGSLGISNGVISNEVKFSQHILRAGSALDFLAVRRASRRSRRSRRRQRRSGERLARAARGMAFKVLRHARRHGAAASPTFSATLPGRRWQAAKWPGSTSRMTGVSMRQRGSA
jgi:opacity protein-like surface antigen